MKTKLESEMAVDPAATCSSSFEYPCTDCGGDAYIGMSNWSESATGKIIIGKNERLCNRCAKKRNIEWSFHAKHSPKNEKAMASPPLTPKDPDHE